MEKVAIIGMGVSGVAVLLAYQKLKMEDPKFQVSLDCYDSSISYGKGKAFREEASQALINSRSHQISYDYEQLSDFSEWLSKKGNQPVSEYTSRGMYGNYLEERSQQLVEDLGARVFKSKVKAIQWLPTLQKWSVCPCLSQGAHPHVTYYDRIHLCCGEFPSFDLYRIGKQAHYLNEAYPLTAIPESLNQAKTVTIIGTGLSAVDVCKYLQENRQVETINLFSRSGYFPTVRGKDCKLDYYYLRRDLIQSIIDKNQGRFTVEDFRTLWEAELARFELDDQACKQYYFLPGIQGIRNGLENSEILGILQNLFLQASDVMTVGWEAMSLSCRQNFNEAYGKLMVCMRNPMPKQSAEEIIAGVESGQLTILQDIEQIHTLEEGFQLVDKTGQTYSTDWLINATGMDLQMRDCQRQEPLIRHLLDQAYGQVDTAGGLSINLATGQVISPRWGQWSTLHAYGMLVNGPVYMNNSTIKIQQEAEKIIKGIYQKTH